MSAYVSCWITVLGCLCAIPRTGLGQAIQEREPNNGPASATPVRLGESVDARMSMPGDVDYFALDLEAGTSIKIDWTGLPNIIDWNWVVSLHDAAGATLVRANGVTWVLTDSTIDRTAHRQMWFTIPQTGRYVVHFFVEPTWAGADPNRIAGVHPYQVRVETFRARPESESNNTAGLANVMSLGDTVSGALSSHADVDYFALDLDVGTNLALRVAVGIVGCNQYPLLKLFSEDGTQLAQETSTPAGGTFNPIIDYPIASSGRYFISLSSWASPSGPGMPCYFLGSGTYTLPPPGPGEPTRMVASNVGVANFMIGSRRGDVFLATGGCEVPERKHGRDKIVRLEPSGTMTLVADSLTSTAAPVVDGFGDLLQPGLGGAGGGLVWRISPTGERSVFVEGLQHPCGIALGPDGDVWVAENGGPLLRFDPLGQLKDSVPRPPYIEGAMMFSPDGSLYLVSNGIHRLENGQWTRPWFPSRVGMSNLLAFDRDGYAYTVEHGYFGYNLRSKIMLADPSGRAVVNPLAWLNDPIALALQGQRLLVLRRDNTGRSDIVEINPDAVRAPGYFPLGVLTVRLELDSLRPAALGVAYRDTLRAANDSARGPWTIINGEIPDGLTFDPTTGVLAGTPVTAGTFGITLRATVGNRPAFGRTVLSVSAPPQIAVDEIVQALLGGEALPADVAAYLDQAGNKNGRLDVGDLRAYLRAQGRLN